MSSARKISLAAVAALFLAAAPFASAQQPSPDAGGGVMGQGMMGPGMMRGAMPMMMMRMAQHMAERVEGRLAFLKTELAITDAQMPSWNAFAEAVRANAKGVREAHPARVNPMQMTVPQRLDLHERMLSTHLEALQRMKAPLEALYAALSDEQKKTADELMTGPMGMMLMM